MIKTISQSAEAKIIEAMTDIQEDPDRWVAVCFGFSRLLDHYKSEYQQKISINLIKDVLGDDTEATIFVCDDASIYVLAYDVSKASIDKMVFQLRYLFMDDPLSYNSEGEENPEFSTSYDLERQWDDFMQISKGRLTQRIKSAGKKTHELQQQPKPGVEKKKKAAPSDPKVFNAASLSGVERDLTNADLSKVMRRQPICAAVPDTMVRRVLDEMYINIAHLRKVLGIEVDLLSNKWLFKYLTEILDDRMLALIQRSPSRFLDSPISLNLNIPTLLSKRFAEFDASIKPATKVSIVVEIQLSDVFADMSAFLTAKDHIQKLGYRVCLDGVTDLSFMQIDRKRLGFDLIKLQWNADIESDLDNEGNRELNDAIKECGVNRVILTRCDSRKAVDYGQAMGISLFQGRYLDSLMDPQATIEN